jgi:hypothetical protein
MFEFKIVHFAMFVIHQRDRTAKEHIFDETLIVLKRHAQHGVTACSGE